MSTTKFSEGINPAIPDIKKHDVKTYPVLKSNSS